MCRVCVTRESASPPAERVSVPPPVPTRVPCLSQPRGSQPARVSLTHAPPMAPVSRLRPRKAPRCADVAARVAACQRPPGRYGGPGAPPQRPAAHALLGQEILLLQSRKQRQQPGHAGAGQRGCRPARLPGRQGPPRGRAERAVPAGRGAGEGGLWPGMCATQHVAGGRASNSDGGLLASSGPPAPPPHAYPYATLAPGSASPARRGCGTGRRLGCRAVALGCTLR